MQNNYYSRTTVIKQALQYEYSYKNYSMITIKK